MRRLVAATIVGAAALVLAAPAQSAVPTNAQLARQTRALQKQVKTLQKQVKTLQKQMKQAQLLATASIVYTGCSVAVTADAFEGTWTVIDQVAGRTIFGPQAPLNDYGVCTALQITRTPTQVPPTAAGFNSLLRLLQS